MSVLAPLGLAALVAIPIIVLLHMRHTTPLVRSVPTLRFWLAAQPERTERTRLRRPPLSLLMLLQLLIAAAVAIALARPVSTQALDGLGLGSLAALRTEPRHLILLLDGSTSMTATDTPSGQTRFEAARAAALARLADLREGDVATVLLLGTRTTTLGATDTGSLNLLRQRVGDLTLPGGRADLDAALALTKDLLLPGLDDEVVVLTDGAVSVDPGVAADLGAPVDLVLVGGAATGQPTANVAVVDVSARATPDNPALLELYTRVLNFSPTAVTAPVALAGDGIEVGRQTVTLPPNGGAAELSWPLPPGTGEATVRVETTDALPADNEASLVLRQGAEGELALKILLISDAPADLQRALQALPGAQVTTESSDNLDAALQAASYDLIVFDRSAPTEGSQTGLGAPLLFVNPPTGGPFQISGAMPEPTVSRLRAQDPLLAGVDLAGVTFGETPIYKLDGTQTEVVGAADGPLVFRATVDNQSAIVLAFDLGSSNLPQRVAFPILIANAVDELAPSPLPSAVPLGDPLVYRPRVDAATVRITPPQGEPVDLPLAADAAQPAATEPTAPAAADAQGAAPNRLREIAFADTGQPGAYAVSELAADGTELGGGRFIVNAGHPRESDLRPSPDLAAVLATAHGTEAGGLSRSNLIDFWPLLAFVAFVLLALEWLVALAPRRRAIRAQPAAATAQPPASGRR